MNNTEYIHRFVCLLGIAAVCLIISCSSESRYNYAKRRMEESNFIYFKNMKTNLCYSMCNYNTSEGSMNSGTFTCVPCDSLKNVEIIELENENIQP